VTFLEGMDFLCSNILIPIGGLSATILVGWIFGTKKSLKELQEGSEGLFKKIPALSSYFSFCFKYLAPILILIVLMNQLL
jgi:NSS family neurotransmitter:Na+ symporter